MFDLTIAIRVMCLPSLAAMATVMNTAAVDTVGEEVSSKV